MRPELDDTQAGASPALEATQKSPSDPTHTRTGTGAHVQPAADGELPAGFRLGHFRIDRRLGAGGMGEVYLATDLALDRPVAVKVLPAGVASGIARDRLIREARAQARILHPNVAHIYFIGEEASRLYFAMEYVTGQTLAERLGAGPVSVEEALALIHGAALGLREAQLAGFTHRDVKPSNLMVDGHGVLKVLDFGLATGAGTTGERPGAGPVAQTTIGGTPLYMAPEQARGEAIDLRADIYALGATLYHLVSGRPPFQADSADELITLHATAPRPPTPRGANPRAAIVAIEALIAQMMAPSPADRFASYEELLQAIEQSSVQHTRPAGFWVRSIASGLDLILISIAMGLVTSALGRRDGNVGREVIAIAAAYCVLTIGRWGTTAGMALFELEVVSVATGGRPSWRQALAREVTLMAAPIGLTVAARMATVLDAPDVVAWILNALASFSVAIIVLLLLHASLEVPGKRAPWDRVSGTLVRYRTMRRERGQTQRARLPGRDSANAARG